MALSDSVPSSALDVLKRNSEDFDKVTNDAAASVTTRTGKKIITLEEYGRRFNETLANLGLEYPPIDYVAGLTVERNTQVYRFNNVLYINTRQDLPFTTTGAFDEGGWQIVQQVNQSTVIFSSDGIKGLDAVALIDRASYSVSGFYAGTEVGGGQFIYDASRSKADHNGGTVITPEAIAVWDGTQANLSVLLDWPGTGTGAFVRVNYDRITPEMVGAVNGLNNSNHIALTQLAKQDWPVDWGGKSYGIKEEIGGGTKLGAINWNSSGCEIYLDPLSTQKRSLMRFQVLPLAHNIKGQLYFNAREKAHNGLWLENPSSDPYPSGYATLTAKALRAENIRRSDDSFEGGSGILIRGSFSYVDLVSPIARNVKLAAGAGISSVVGVSGISLIRHSGGGYPLYCSVKNPIIENVESEDLTYEDDQDGIRFFGGLSETDMWSSFSVEGGQFTNCFGRSIKSQMSSGKVSGSHFKRDRGFSSGVGNEEIAGQRGFVDVENITFEYDGFVPAAVVTQSSGPLNKSSSVMSSIKGIVKGAAQLPCVIGPYSDDPMPTHNVDGVSVDGSLARLVDFLTPSVDAVLNLSNVSVNSISGELVRVITGGKTVQPLAGAVVNTHNVVNTGVPVPLLRHRVSGNSASAYLSATGRTIGFTGADYQSLTLDNPMIRSPIGRLTADTIFSSGFMTIESETIGGGVTFGFPLHGKSNVGLALLNVSFSDAYCMVSYSNTTSSEIFKGDNFLIGGSAEPSPVGEVFLVWVEAGELKVKNTNVSARNVTVNYFATG